MIPVYQLNQLCRVRSTHDRGVRIRFLRWVRRVKEFFPLDFLIESNDKTFYCVAVYPESRTLEAVVPCVRHGYSNTFLSRVMLVMNF